MISGRAPGQEFRKIFEKKHWVFDVFMLKCLQTHCVRYNFDINARGCTLWYFLQWIIAVDDRTSIASAPRGDMTSLDLTKFFRFLLFSYDFSKSARAGNLQNFCGNALGF